MVPSGPLYLEETRALNGDVERIIGLVQFALGIDDFGRRGPGAQADLQSGRHCALALGRARRHHVLIHHVLKLQAQLAKTRGRRVGQVVGDGVEVHLLCAHAAGSGIQSSNHLFPRLRTRLSGQIFGGKLVELRVEHRQCALHHLRLALHHDQIERALDHILIGGLKRALVDRCVGRGVAVTPWGAT